MKVIGSRPKLTSPPYAWSAFLPKLYPCVPARSCVSYPMANLIEFLAILWTQRPPPPPHTHFSNCTQMRVHWNHRGTWTLGMLSWSSLVHILKICGGFPGQFQTFSNQFNVSSNQFRPKCDRGNISEFKFVFGYSNSTTQRPNCKLHQPI